MVREETRRLLRNWGRYCRQDNGAPDSSCTNSLYDMMVRHDNDGYGEITELTLFSPQTHEAVPESEELDDAECQWVDGHILTLPQNHRAVLCVRYVLCLPCKTPDAKDRLLAAMMDLQSKFYGEAYAYG